MTVPCYCIQTYVYTLKQHMHVYMYADARIYVCMYADSFLHHRSDITCFSLISLTCQELEWNAAPFEFHKTWKYDVDF